MFTVNACLYCFFSPWSLIETLPLVLHPQSTHRILVIPRTFVTRSSIWKWSYRYRPKTANTDTDRSIDGEEETTTTPSQSRSSSICPFRKRMRIILLFLRWMGKRGIPIQAISSSRWIWLTSFQGNASIIISKLTTLHIPGHRCITVPQIEIIWVAKLVTCCIWLPICLPLFSSLMWSRFSRWFQKTQNVTLFNIQFSAAVVHFMGFTSNLNLLTQDSVPP